MPRYRGKLGVSADVIGDILASMLARYPALRAAEDDIMSAFAYLEESFRRGGKLLVCGNGGSAADAEHRVGELMKGFVRRRPVSADLARRMTELFGATGARLAGKLQGALPAIALAAHVGLTTAFNNDVDPSATFAQQVHGYGRKGDSLLAISTSGNAPNVIGAAMVARAQGLAAIGLSGETGGALAGICDVCIRVPSGVTYEIQEYHLPVYHCLCMMLEEAFFTT